jgi:hypothetical protein
MKSIPVARGLLLCEAVRSQEGTEHVTLVNCFSGLTAPSFPCANRAFNVVAFLSDGYGDLRARVQITHLDRERTIYVREHGLTTPDRLREVRYSFQVTGCVFPEAGVYEVELFIQQELIADTRFFLRLQESTRE